MTSRTCYLIVGRTGFWEETKWVHRAFFNLQSAEKELAKLYSIIDKVTEDHKGLDDADFGQIMLDSLRDLDAKVYIEDGYISYEIDTCEIDS